MEKGSSISDVLIGAAIIIFIILPVFSAVVERYILFAKVQIIKDAVDITNISAYNALKTDSLGKTTVDFHNDKISGIYKKILAGNMKLDLDLNPTESSVADDTVIIKSIIIYTENIPNICPYGTSILRPAVHSCIVVPVKPTIYSRIIRKITGKNTFKLEVHVDSDIPINN
ncbi:MAG TPA: hypothetical protein PK733_12475 [Clostridiales bacterium]|nr:hypothetical protein [Clostridiales bacterium]